MGEAFTILGYFEHLAEDEQPPERMWGNDEALEQWFEDVKIRRSGADNPAMERVPDPPQGYTRNALVDELMGDRRRG